MADSSFSEGSDTNNSDCEGPVSSYQVPNINHQTLEQTQKIAKELAGDIVYYKCNESYPVRPVNVYAATLRRTVDEISQRHEILFNSMVNKLKISTEDNGLLQTFINVVEEMFRDKHYNWGRVVTVYAFGGKLAKYSMDIGKHENVQLVAEYVGAYVAEKLAPWICSQGGWGSFLQYFPDEKSMEGTLWKGLLYTVVGLGALATMVVAR